jgi:hypothetical protein
VDKQDTGPLTTVEDPQPSQLDSSNLGARPVGSACASDKAEKLPAVILDNALDSTDGVPAGNMPAALVKAETDQNTPDSTDPGAPGSVPAGGMPHATVDTVRARLTALLKPLGLNWQGLKPELEPLLPRMADPKLHSAVKVIHGRDPKWFSQYVGLEETPDGRHRFSLTWEFTLRLLAFSVPEAAIDLTWPAYTPQTVAEKIPPTINPAILAFRIKRDIPGVFAQFEKDIFAQVEGAEGTEAGEPIPEPVEPVELVDPAALITPTGVLTPLTAVAGAKPSDPLCPLTQIKPPKPQSLVSDKPTLVTQRCSRLLESRHRPATAKPASRTPGVSKSSSAAPVPPIDPGVLANVLAGGDITQMTAEQIDTLPKEQAEPLARRWLDHWMPYKPLSVLLSPPKAHPPANPSTPAGISTQPSAPLAPVIQDARVLPLDRAAAARARLAALVASRARKPTTLVTPVAAEVTA